MNPLNNFNNPQNNSSNNNNQNQNNNNNPMEMFNKFMNFTQGLKGNPTQMIQSLLDNGTMSQSQLNQILPMARQVINNPLMKRMINNPMIKNILNRFIMK